MAYAALADVQRELGKHAVALTANSVPSQDDVTDSILPDIAGEIDAALSVRGITVPVTAPSSFVDRLEGLNALGAAARVDAALFPQSAGPASTNLAQWLQDRYDAGLEALRKGEGVPLEATNSGGGLPRSFSTSHPLTSSEDLDSDTPNDIEPVFRRDTVW